MEDEITVEATEDIIFSGRMIAKKGRRGVLRENNLKGRQDARWWVGVKWDGNKIYRDAPSWKLKEVKSENAKGGGAEVAEVSPSGGTG